MTDEPIVTAEGGLIKIESNKMAHYIPVIISGHEKFPLKMREKHIVELYEDHIVIRLKRNDE